MEPKLKQGDIVKVNKPVAAVNMEAGDYYRVEYLKTDYYEEHYFLSKSDKNGENKEGDLIEIPARSLDFWVDTDSIEVMSLGLA